MLGVIDQLQIITGVCVVISVTDGSILAVLA